MLKEILAKVVELLIGPPDSMTKLELEAALTKRAAENGQDLNWRESIIDLLKLLDLDSSLGARKRLADDLGYNGTAADGSAEKNIWLHKAVMQRVADHGIAVPRNML